MKNIAIVITRLDLGGAQKIALYIAEKLDREKYNVHLITGEGGYFDEKAKEIKNLNLVFMKSLKHPISLSDDMKTVKELKKYFVDNRISVVHTHSSKAGLLGRIAAKKAGVKKIVHTVHGFSFHEYQNPFMHFIYVLIERYAAKKTDILVAVGDDVVEYGLKKKVGTQKQYTVIRAGVEVSKFRASKDVRTKFLEELGLRPKAFTVGMLGNLKPQKNPLEFVEIANQVLQVDDSVQFVFAGDGPLRSEVEEKIREYNITDNVKFMGWVERPEDLIASIDVFILTSLWEGLPCTLAQAAAAKKPCIATNIGGNREILNDMENGLLYEPFAYKEAAEKIILVKNMERDEAKYDKKADAILKEFDVKFMLKQHEELYG